MKKLISILLSAMLCQVAIGQPKVDGTIPESSTPIDFKNFKNLFTAKHVKKVSIYGGGSLLNLLSNADTSQSPSSISGSLGLNFNIDEWTCSFYFSYNGKEKLEMKQLSQFGSVLMNPNITGQALSIIAHRRLGSSIGLRGSLLAVDNDWILDDYNTPEDDDITVDASPFVAKIGVYFEPFKFTLSGDNKLRGVITANFTHRSIIGDFNNNIYRIEGQEIKPRGYNGFDFTIETYLNSINVYGQFSVNPKADKIDFNIPGFTGVQLLFGVNVTGALATLEAPPK